MSMRTTVDQGQETEAAALHRLARQAREKGVEIVIDEDNRHWASSSSRSGERYVITLASCSCAGFIRHRRCHHFAAILEAYHSLPPIEPPPSPVGGGAALPVPAWTLAHEPEGERPPFAVRYAGTDSVDRPVRRFWREPAARTECELLNRAAERAAEVVPAPAEDVLGDVVVLVQPARSPRPAVEGAHVALAGTRSDGSTYLILHADAVVVDGVPLRVGDAVEATDKRWGWVLARITGIRTVGSTGRVWKVDVDGTGYGETTRSLSEVRAVVTMDEMGEGVRHAA